MKTQSVTRLAPSPTGALHLGNARTFLINWALARQRGWRIAMRMEDLDSPRVKGEAVSETYDVLRWLGVDWDTTPLIQSDDLHPYEEAMRHLAGCGLLFSCPLTRREISEVASAPQDGAHVVPYPQSLRPCATDRGRWVLAGRGVNYRMVVPDGIISFEDAIAGRQRFDLAKESGDFVVWTKRGMPGYQLAVVVDDIRQGVTDVVRGDDLLLSTAMQLMLYRAMDQVPPRWWHVPLVYGEDGRRLAKRHGDTRLVTYREAGVPATRIIGLLAMWCGVVEDRCELTAEEFRLSFDVDMLPREEVTFTRQDHAWLLHGSSPSSSVYSC